MLFLSEVLNMTNPLLGRYGITHSLLLLLFINEPCDDSFLTSVYNLSDPPTVPDVKCRDFLCKFTVNSLD